MLEMRTERSCSGSTRRALGPGRLRRIRKGVGDGLGTWDLLSRIILGEAGLVSLRFVLRCGTHFWFWF